MLNQSSCNEDAAPTAPLNSHYAIEIGYAACHQRPPSHSYYQLLRLVFAVNGIMSCIILSLPHSGQIVFFLSCSAILCVNVNCLPHASHRYSYVGMESPSFSTFSMQILIYTCLFTTRRESFGRRTGLQAEVNHEQTEHGNRSGGTGHCQKNFFRLLIFRLLRR